MNSGKVREENKKDRLGMNEQNEPVFLLLEMTNETMMDDPSSFLHYDRKIYWRKVQGLFPLFCYISHTCIYLYIRILKIPFNNRVTKIPVFNP